MPNYLKANWDKIALFMIALALILAVVFKRPVKVSVSDNIFIELGINEASIGVIETAPEGPPARYVATFELASGKRVYVNLDGSCRVEEK